MFRQSLTRVLMKLMQKRFNEQMQDPDPYNRTFVAMTGRDKYDMSFITKESLINQFQSDLITPLPEQIDNGETLGLYPEDWCSLVEKICL